MKNTTRKLILSFSIVAMGIFFTLLFMHGLKTLAYRPTKAESIKNGSIVVLGEGGSIRLVKPSEIDSTDINLGIVTINVIRYSWGSKVKEINPKDLDK